jgi:RimJ/RimL family protein N-acetyltransferase
MRIKIIKRQNLNEEQVTDLRARTTADEHLHDPGPCHSWDMESLASFIFVVVLKETDKAIGLLYRGGPPNATSVSWWIDQRYRERGFGNEMVDLFATILKEEGVTGIAPLPIEPYQGQQNVASERLAARLRKHFNTQILDKTLQR